MKRPCFVLCLVAALAVSALAPCLSATAIVVFRQPTHIILAGDSVLAGRDDGQTETRFLRSCKVRPAGKWWFVIGGFSRRVGTHAIDVYEVVEQAIAPTATMLDALEAIRRNAGPVYASLKASQSAKPAASGLPLLTIVIGGLDRGVLTVGAFSFELQRADPFEATATLGTCPGPGCDADGAVFYAASVGADMPAVKLMNQRPRPPWLQAGTAAAARRLILLQAAATPTRVGGPVDVLEIRADGGARWMWRDAASTCPAIPIRPKGR
ncbi:MAG: hypothetical protein NTV05_05170 [Acidobacteria bacterium]|nr:hypothetical protein [Acidobacteriota bacterium]